MKCECVKKGGGGGVYVCADLWAAAGDAQSVTVHTLDLHMRAGVDEEPAPQSLQGNQSNPPTAKKIRLD